MNEEKKVPFKWEYGEETISLQLGMYANNQRLYIGMITHTEDGAEAFADMTVNLPGYSLDPGEAFISGDISKDLLRFIKENKLGNPFAYIHSEKDILKLVTTLIANTKGEGKAGDDFWVKAETLLYCALIGYIHYEAPVEEQNFSTLIEFINAMEVREDDEEFKNPVDLMFDALEAEKPNHFAVRQYKKYKLAAGDICSK